MTKDGSEYSLHLTSEDKEGLYECRAENSVGESSGEIEVTGKAPPVAFKSVSEVEKVNQLESEYTLKWVVNSKTKVNSFKVKYGKVGESEGTVVETTATKVAEESYSG